MNNTCQNPNYRIYDRTGGGQSHDIYAETLEEAIDQGRDWIEDGDWSSEEDGTYRTITLECAVREIIRFPTPNADGKTTSHDGTELFKDEEGDLIDAHGHFYYSADDCGKIDESATADGFAHDCSGEYSDPLPVCTANSDGDHDWQSPLSLVGGCTENPGVWSNGGTCYTTECVCAFCGCYATETDKGTQCHPSEAKIKVEIKQSDEASINWIKNLHNGYLPRPLAELMNREDETLEHMQERFGDILVSAQDISIGIWNDIKNVDISKMSLDEANEWLAEIQERLEQSDLNPDE